MSLIKENITVHGSVVTTEASEDIIALAKTRGIDLPHPALAVFSSVLCEIEKPNANKVRLGKKATQDALSTLIGTQVNFNHERRGNICGYIFDSRLNKNDEVEISCIYFKDIYNLEYETAMDLFKDGELTMSFELSAEVESQDKLNDGTRRINDFYFTGAGLLLGEKPACKKAIVYEFAQQELECVFAQKEPTIMKTIESLYAKKNSNLVKIYANVDNQEEIDFNIAMSFYYADDTDKNLINEEAKKWTRKFINDLPDSAFAVIEPAYKSGDVEDKNARHLPHHDGDGDLGKKQSNKNVDKPHLRNALARVNQIEPVTDSIDTEKLRNKASNHLEKHKNVLEKAQEEKETMNFEELKQSIIAELGDVVKDWTDEDFKDEAKVEEAKATKATEDAKIEEDRLKAEADEKAKADLEAKEKEEADEKAKADAEIAKTTYVTDQTTKTTETFDENETVTVVEGEVTQTYIDSDGKESKRTRKFKNEEVYMYAKVIAMKAEYDTKIAELEATLKAKDSEIENVRANAEKIGKMKVELANNKFVADFSDEDYLDETKVEEAKTSMANELVISERKEELKDNEFASDFEDKDYLNEDKVELAKTKKELEIAKTAKTVPDTKTVKIDAKKDDFDAGENVVIKGISPLSKLLRG